VAEHNSTRLCAPGVRKQHPRHNLIGHPFPQLDQHGLVPLARTRLENMRLDMLIAYARDERLVSVRKPEDLEGRPQFGALNGRRDIGRRALGEKRERRGEELFESSRKGSR
jgi:hypothetical protein